MIVCCPVPALFFVVQFSDVLPHSAAAASSLYIAIKQGKTTWLAFTELCDIILASHVAGKVSAKLFKPFLCSNGPLKLGDGAILVQPISMQRRPGRMKS